jgi:tRNA-modifying protein YgfZ
MNIAHLAERGVIRIGGADARSFLDGLVTNDMAAVTPQQAGYGALLTPQGKIISDFFLIALTEEDGGGYLLDGPAALALDLLKRFNMYKLRAAVAVEDMSATTAVIACADGGALPEDAGVVFTDPRHPSMGQRAIVSVEDVTELANAPFDDYQTHRIVLGMPEGGKDFGYGGQMTFAHEALLDQLHGVSFTKGCYVGQEVVSRMQHRGTARTRCIPVRFVDGLRSEWGVNILAGGKQIGQIGSTAAGRGLAMVRLDRWHDAIAAGDKVLAGGLEIEPVKPPFITFPFPGDADFAAGGDA